jgi:hypothetical protein
MPLLKSTLPSTAQTLMILMAALVASLYRQSDKPFWAVPLTLLLSLLTSLHSYVRSLSQLYLPPRIIVWHWPGYVTVLWPHHSRWPTQPSTSNSNTSSSGTSQSTLEAVAPDTLDWWTTQILVAQ